MSSFLSLQLLAILQGLTEFLPVSSSGHLALLKQGLGLEFSGEGPLLELLLHGGTLGAVLVFYRKRLGQLLLGLCRGEKAAWRYAGLVVLCCLPAGIVYLLAHDFLEEAFQAPRVIGGLLLLTGLVLLSLRWVPSSPHRQEGAPTWKQALGIGLAQACAILPGLSRSGSTYTAARWLKVSSQEAFDFSFLVSIPLILASILLKAKDILTLTTTSGESPAAFLTATLLSALVGYGALALLAKLRFLGKIWIFAPYCLLLGTLTLLLA